MTMPDRIDNDARNVITAHGMLGNICAVVWREDGHVKSLSMKGCEEAIALMLYTAADAHADRTKPNIKLENKP